MVAEGAVMAALTVVLALVTFYVPVVGTVLTFFLPAPVALVTARHGPGPALASIVVAGLALVLFVGPVQALGLAVVFAFMGLALGYGIGRRWAAGQTIALGGVAFLLVAATFVALSRFVLHEDVLTLFLSTLREAATTAEAWHLPGGAQYAATLRAVADQLAKDPFVLAAPFALAVLVFSALFYSALRPIFRRLGLEVPRLTSFAAWRVPYAVAWVWFGTMLLVFLQAVPALRWAGLAGSYLYAAFAQVFLVVGASVAYFVLRYFRMSVAVSGALAFLFALSPLWSTIVLFAGLFETLFGLRGRLLPRLADDHPLRAELSAAAWAQLEASLRPFFGDAPRPGTRPTARSRGPGATKKAKEKPTKAPARPSDPNRGPGGGKRKRRPGSAPAAPARGQSPAGRRPPAPARPEAGPARRGPERDPQGRVIRGRMKGTKRRAGPSGRAGGGKSG